MISKVIDGVCSTISQEFEDGYDIFTDSVPQNLPTPCFFARIIAPASNRFRNNRYRDTNKIEVQYIPMSETEPNLECYEVIDRLNDCLADITIDGSIVHGSNLSGEVTDGILNYSVNYDFFTVKPTEEIDKMEDIRIVR